MRVGITGANGFIGNHLVRYIASSFGHRIIAFLHEGTSDVLIRKYIDRAFWGDVTSPESLNPFLEDCDVLFHLAGFNRYWSKDSTVFHRVNCVGPKNIAAGCEAHGIGRLVHVSSCVTLGASDGPVLRNEESEFNLQGLGFLYAETKKAGEDEMKRWALERDLPVVIVNPASAIGEMDYAPTPIGKPIMDICRGFWPFSVGGGACFIDVRDLVRGLWLALEKGQAGNQYLLVGENLSNKDFMSRVAILAGRRHTDIEIPRSLLGFVAHCSEWIADHVTHRNPLLTVGMHALIGKHLYFDGAKAKHELGFEAGPCDAAIERSVRWFKDNGYVQS